MSLSENVNKIYVLRTFYIKLMSSTFEMRQSCKTSFDSHLKKSHYQIPSTLKLRTNNNLVLLFSSFENPVQSSWTHSPQLNERRSPFAHPDCQLWRNAHTTRGWLHACQSTRVGDSAMRRVVRPKQHCPPDSGSSASCCHFFYLAPPRSCSPPGSFVEHRVVLVHVSRSEPKLIKRGRSLHVSKPLPPLLVPRPCANAHFSSIKILSSAIPSNNSVRNNEGNEEQKGERGGRGNEEANGHVPTMGI